MTDTPKSFLAAGTTLADTAIKSLQEWRGFLDTLSSRAAEFESLKQQVAAEKTQLANVRANAKPPSSGWKRRRRPSPEHWPRSVSPRPSSTSCA